VTVGFSVSGSAALLFVALLIGAGMMQSAAGNGFERVTDATDDDRERLLERQNTAIEIVAVEYNGTSGALSVRARNDGSTGLSTEAVDLLVEGSYVDAETSVANATTSTGLWLPGETLVANATVASADRVKLVTGPGVADTEVR
jgi:flagellar protein FlaF